MFVDLLSTLCVRQHRAGSVPLCWAGKVPHKAPKQPGHTADSIIYQAYLRTTW